MEELREVLSRALTEDLNTIVMSNTRDANMATKAKIRPVLIGGALKFQETRYQGTKVFHQNFSREEMAARIEDALNALFKQCEIDARELSCTILVSKKGRMTVKTRWKKQDDIATAQEKERADATDQPQEGALKKADRERLGHDRTKQYILQEGEPVDFLIGLGVQTPDGRITKNRYDKFRQINRYLEFIEDVLDNLPKDRTIRIVDFGCGKSYLTFAMYYYLHVREERDIQVVGLDLKEDVIRHCNELAQHLHYDGLRFEQGDIKNYQGADRVDLVVSLHACDLATDYALEKAVKWGAEVILAVPCCQHEFNRQIKNDTLFPALKYGIIKERMAALFTDAVRAELLEAQGYDTQILEFIDMEHTPKNLLIRAVKRSKMRPAKEGEALREMERFLGIHPTLERLLQERRDGAV